MTPTRDDAAEWLAKASEDLRVAEDLLRLGHDAAAAFHAQQAGEKALKAMLIHKTGRLERTHDLQRLCHLAGVTDALVVESAEVLSTYYTATRYPGAAGHIAHQDASDALQRARGVVAWCAKTL